MERITITERVAFKPVRLPVTVVLKGGLCARSVDTPLSLAIQELCHANGMGFSAIETTDKNGLGPDEVLKSLQFEDLLETSKAEILALAPDGHSKFVLVEHSLYGWIFTALAVDPQLKELIVAVLLLAPAMDSLTKFYFKMK